MREAWLKVELLSTLITESTLLWSSHASAGCG